MSKTLPEIQPSPWFFQEPPTDFDAALVMQWVGQFIKPYNRLEDNDHRRAFYPGAALRNAQRLVRDLWTRNRDYSEPPAGPGRTDGLSLHDEVEALLQIRNWCQKNLDQRSGKSNSNPGRLRQTRLVADSAEGSVALDGNVYPVGFEAALFVDALIKADGDWRSGPEIADDKTLPAGTRVDRLYHNKLNRTLQKLIEVVRGKGYRLIISLLE